ncbi:MAG: UbiA family prenyltransferase [Nocardioidaceae bacterium]|nr:UbiA family prenyltransferase [Nocardioidaceae bacterium]
MAILRRRGKGRPAGEDTQVEEVPEGDAAEPADADADLNGSDATDPVDERAEEPDVPGEGDDDHEPEWYEVDDRAQPEAEAPEAEAEARAPEAAEETPEDDHDDELPVDANPVVEKPRRGLRGTLVVSLIQASHVKQAITTALIVGGVAAVSGRSAREAGVVTVTVLVGQMMLGWHNDLTDRTRDARHQIAGKPLADGRLEPGTVVYAMVVGLCLLVPLSVTTGITAGCIYLASVAIGMLGNVAFRTGLLSFWSWAVSYAMIPYYLSYGGWGGRAVGSPPEPAIVALAALLGVGVHFMRSVWGLVADHEDGWTYLPLKVALKLGATRLLAIATTYTVVVVVLLAVVGSQVGLSRCPTGRIRRRRRTSPVPGCADR